MSNDTNYGTTIGSRHYGFGCDAIIEAIPSGICHRFLNWTDVYDNVISEKQVDTITIFGDSVLIANFEVIILNLTLEAIL